MIFAHIPAGYLLADAFVRRKRWPKILLWVGMIGGTFPDIDIIYARFVAPDFFGHRHYLTHLPSVWLLLAAIALVAIILTNRRAWLKTWAVFFSAVLLHIFLDWIVGRVYLFAPFSWNAYGLLPEAPACEGVWLVCDMLRPAFLLEILIIAAAAIRFFRGGYKNLFGAER
jgi:membrane-bound metal-dependent hydrolase YbcI (DUF457 family)